MKPLLPLLLLSLAGAARVCAQGGPPMLTDDPGTPGPNKWEINVGWTTQQSPGSTVSEAPQMDLNYGIGDRIELTYFASYLDVQDTGEPSRWGMSDSELACKWRFYDAGEKGLQVSVYPQVNFLTPSSHSDRRGLADGNTSYQLPLQFEKDSELVNVDVDFGPVFATGKEEDSWFGGICLGKEVKKGWELDAEVHVNADAHVGKTECIGDVATRIDLAENYTLMLLLGRDLSNQLGPKISLMSYVGIQLRL